jgi:hypothetical protein
MKVKEVQDLEIDDKIDVAGIICEVKKVEDVFHYVPKARIRLTLKRSGSTDTRFNAILFFPIGTEVLVL